MSQISIETVVKLWGKEFFDECRAEAAALPGYLDRISSELILVIAIGKLNKKISLAKSQEGSIDHEKEEEETYGDKIKSGSGQFQNDG